MPTLEAIFLERVPDLYAAAHSGDVHAATVAMRRLITSLRDIDPSLAEALKSQVAGRAAPGTRRTAVPVGRPPSDRDSQHGLLRLIDVRDALGPVLNESQANALAGFLAEHERAEQLAAADLAPRRTLFLVGPPGVGKTMSAAWIAKKLQLSLFQLDISSLMSSYLGRTGQNLREVFDFAKSNAAVVLLDEFDAVAKRRDDTMDVGEVRRVVSVLLKEIEEWPGPSILVAATNHPELIDPAVFRRFQLTVHLDAPGPPEAARILAMHLRTGPSPAREELVRLAANILAGTSASNLRLFALEARRAVALGHARTLDEALLRMVAGTVRNPKDRQTFVSHARAVLGDREASFAKLAKMLNVSKGTIHNDVHKRGQHG